MVFLDIFYVNFPRDGAIYSFQPSEGSFKKLKASKAKEMKTLDFKAAENLEKIERRIPGVAKILQEAEKSVNFPTC